MSSMSFVRVGSLARSWGVAMGLVVAGAAVIGAAGGCETKKPARVADARAVAVLAPATAATTRPSLNDVRGTVVFAQFGDEVEVVATVTGLEPNTTHGFHIHEKGDLSDPKLLSTGGHWNPDGGHHGAPSAPHSHAGDLGNLKADDKGNARLVVRTREFSLTREPSALGHAVIVHAKADDLTSQPAGNAGDRVAGGVIVAEK